MRCRVRNCRYCSRLFVHPFRVRLGVVRLTGTFPDFLRAKVCRIERLDFRRDLLNRFRQVFDRTPVPDSVIKD
jgi:hypothetical protein